MSWPDNLDYVREKVSAAVATLDSGSGSASLKKRLRSAAITVIAVFVNDFPASIVGDFLSLQHKLAWRGNLDDTINQMTEAEAEDAADALRALYVDVLRLASSP